MTPARPSLPSRPLPARSGPARPAASGAGWIVLLAVFCSVVASAATCFVIIRFSLVTSGEQPAAAATFSLVETTKPAPKPTPARTRPTVAPAPVATDEAPVEEQFNPASSAALRQVASGASLILDVAKTVRDPTNGFIVGSKHSALGNDLAGVETAANRLLQDSGSNPDQTAKTIAQFSTALDRAIARADNIAGRDTEDATSVEIARTLKARLEQVRNSLPQP